MAVRTHFIHFHYSIHSIPLTLQCIISQITMPLVRRKMAAVSQTRHVQDFEVQKALEKILENADLTVLTRKEVRRQLEKQFGGSFSTPEWKANIKQQIQQFVAKRESGVNTHSAPHTTSNAPSNTTSATTNGRSTRRISDRSYDDNVSAAPPQKRRRVGGKAQDEAYFPPSHRSQLRNTKSNGNSNGRRTGGAIIGAPPYRPRLQSNKTLIQQNPQDNSHFIKLPGTGPPKRCVLHKFKGRLYVGFREYYEKNGEMLPTKKGMEFVFICSSVL